MKIIWNGTLPWGRTSKIALNLQPQNSSSDGLLELYKRLYKNPSVCYQLGRRFQFLLPRRGKRGNIESFAKFLMTASSGIMKMGTVFDQTCIVPVILRLTGWSLTLSWLLACLSCSTMVARMAANQAVPVQAKVVRGPLKLGATILHCT